MEDHRKPHCSFWRMGTPQTSPTKLTYLSDTAMLGYIRPTGQIRRIPEYQTFCSAGPGRQYTSIFRGAKWPTTALPACNRGCPNTRPPGFSHNRRYKKMKTNKQTHTMLQGTHQGGLIRIPLPNVSPDDITPQGVRQRVRPLCRPRATWLRPPLKIHHPFPGPSCQAPVHLVQI
jgi:hypothetical protein